MSEESDYTGPPKLVWGTTINYIVDPYFNEIKRLQSLLERYSNKIEKLDSENEELNQSNNDYHSIIERFKDRFKIEEVIEDCDCDDCEFIRLVTKVLKE